MNPLPIRSSKTALLAVLVLLALAGPGHTQTAGPLSTPTPAAPIAPIAPVIPTAASVATPAVPAVATIHETRVTATAPTPAHAGFLKSVQGLVQLQAPAGELRAARDGDAISSTDRIITGPASGTSAVLRDGTTLVIGPSSRLDLKDFSFDATTQEGNLLVSLVRGSLRMITGLIGKLRPESVQIETQTATISIRGTDFLVQTDEAQP